MAENKINTATLDQIKNAIRVAENQTSGEMRVHIEKHCRGSALDRAAYLFEELEMYKTDHRNGVLIYLAHHDKKFAILGDSGINSQVEPSFWEEIAIEMQNDFKQDRIIEGICKGINISGQRLREHFPFQEKTDVNELSDDISVYEN